MDLKSKEMVHLLPSLLPLTLLRYSHPYATEIMQYSYPQHVYESAPPIPFTSPQQTSATFVDTEQGVQEMLEELKAAKEIAVDLEHHDYRSYYGIVCLMQISTRNKDWIVDTLKPWRENLQVLNQVFADPQIIKVFHGSSMDMIWLQRDLGLYVVGLFDTFYACEALQFPGRGLKYLLSRFANFEAQKQYQLADWRIRPLPVELIDYARSDTHYLLYIYDVLRNMLVKQSTPQQNLIDHVLQGSKKEASQVYTRFIYDKDSGRGANGWYNLFTDHANHFSPQQLAVFRALHEWRDTQAREEDEGVGFICANKVLWMLAESMPTNQTHLYGSGIRPIPPSVLKDTQKIFDIVRKAKQDALSDPPPHEFLRLNHEKYGIPNNRWKKFKEDKAKSQHTGVGATLQQLAQKGDVESLPGTPKQSLENGKPAEAVVHRAERSSLWGPVTTAMSGFSIETQAALAALQSVLPLPKPSTDSFAQANGVDVIPPAQATAAIQASQQLTPTPAAAKPVHDVFTLKQQSRKRKIDDLGSSPVIEDAAMLTPPAPLATSNYHLSDLTSPASRDTPSSAVSLNPTPEMTANKLAKQQRKAEKRARKAAMEAEAAEKAANLIPFDYSSAPNLLNSPASAASTAYGNGQTPKKQKQDGAATGKGQSPGKVGIMNPFAKALDAGTGAKRNRMGKELQGRSRTFQS